MRMVSSEATDRRAAGVDHLGRVGDLVVERDGDDPVRAVAAGLQQRGDGQRAHVAVLVDREQQPLGDRQRVVGVVGHRAEARQRAAGAVMVRRGLAGECVEHWPTGRFTVRSPSSSSRRPLIRSTVSPQMSE